MIEDILQLDRDSRLREGSGDFSSLLQVGFPTSSGRVVSTTAACGGGPSYLLSRHLKAVFLPNILNLLSVSHFGWW